MQTIELKTGTVNPERLAALEADLRANFFDVKAKYFRADLPKGDQTRPKNIFPSEPGKANFVTLRISRHEGLEFYKTAFRSYAIFSSENFSQDNARRINESLMRTGFVKPPEPPKIVMPQLPPQKNIVDVMIDSVKEIVAKVQGMLKI